MALDRSTSGEGGLSRADEECGGLGISFGTTFVRWAVSDLSSTDAKGRTAVTQMPILAGADAVQSLKESR
jgi:hypothetical protein